MIVPLKFILIEWKRMSCIGYMMIVPLKFILIEWKRQAVVFMFLIPTVSWR